MAKSPIRKSLEHLIKKVEALEDQSFAQKLQIDDLENKLALAEENIKQLKDNPFGIVSPAVVTPYVQPLQPIQPVQYPTYNHVCVGGQSDFWTGAIHCTICGALMNNQSWTITATADNVSWSPAGADTEPVLDLDISWVVPDDEVKKD